AVPGFLIIYALIKKFRRTWWLWSGTLSLPVSLFLALVAPIWIDPLFNEFRPMRDKAVEAQILGLARRTGINVDRVFEVGMSRKTGTVNAYVTGLLGTKRIVLWDTLLEKLEPAQVLSVMGHEMGHYVLNHVFQGTLVVGGLVTLGLGIVHHLATRILPMVSQH